MKRWLLILGILVLAIVAGVLINDYDKKRILNLEKVVVASPTPTVVITITPTETIVDAESYPRKAMFKIITKGIVRNLSNAMYQEQSGQAFIPSGYPTTVEITEETTWQEFFDTLPFSLDSECLLTGDGERFCNGEGGTLAFELNGVIVQDALTRTINSSDELIVRFD